MTFVPVDPLAAADLDEDDRYHRQSLISWWDQDRLAAASVLVVGAGALGNELVKNLVLLGVGQVTVVDLDRIENSNLARCVFFRPADEGRHKAEVLAERAAALNADVEVTGLVGDVRALLGVARFETFDVVLGGLDNREARLYVNQACWKTGTPWIDGAIEGLMGVVRVFVPPDTACYECTMSERDHELLAARRTCALLSRDDMLEGKVPTTATSASVVAAMQSQEAVKLLHEDRLGPLALAGGGFHFVGLTHDSYVVRYGRREDCLSHDTYDLAGAVPARADAPLARLLDDAQERLGAEACLDFEHEVVLALDCNRCGTSQPVLRPLFAVPAGAAVCPGCSEARAPRFAHGAEPGDALLERTPAELHLPVGDVIVGRAGFERCFYALEATA